MRRFAFRPASRLGTSLARRGVLALACLSLTLGLAGCGAGDPEQNLIGTWGGDMSAEANAARAIALKRDNPEAEGSTVMAAARALGQTAIEFHADKTCRVQLGLTALAGTWSFDKKRNDVALTLDPPAAAAPPAGENNAAPAENGAAPAENPAAGANDPAAAEPAPAAPPAKLEWTAVIDPNGGKLALYQFDRGGVDAVLEITKGKRPPGAMVLYKQ